jgi:hypothetical protein
MEALTMHSDRRGRAGFVSALTLAALLCPHDAGAQSRIALAVGMQQAQTSAAETSVRDTLQRYSTALESLDANAVKKVQPSMSVENLAKAFKDMRELKVAIDEVRVLSVDGAAARVSCRVTQTLTPKVGSKRTTAVTRVLRLRRTADLWVVDAFER